ncbi:MAG: hypothetical protein LBT10_08705 [Methanobrevibacter sp.]|jgi:hypothetical protein|nr:hypothetical protein [Methanobrevibacter sp.]
MKTGIDKVIMDINYQSTIIDSIGLIYEKKHYLRCNIHKHHTSGGKKVDIHYGNDAKIHKEVKMENGLKKCKRIIILDYNTTHKNRHGL